MYEIRTLEESQIPELTAFLTRVFDMPATSRSVQPALLRWKMFEPHPFWPGPRSYAAWHEGRIVAHGCLLPYLYRYNGGEARAQVIIDWAADPTVRGGGVLIYQALAKLTDIQIGIGGSDDARKALPRMRFETRQTVGTYMRLQNPLKNQPSSAPLDWKTPLRIGRDVLRQVQQGGLGDTGSLQARAVTEFDESVPMPQPGENVISVRTPALLNYALRCPNTEIEGYVLESGGTAAGYCVLARVGTTCRIADLWIDGQWSEAVSLAAQLAARKPCGSVAMNASVTPVRRALEQQGFRLLVEWPLFVKDPAKKLPANREIHVSMLDNDAFYL